MFYIRISCVDLIRRYRNYQNTKPNNSTQPAEDIDDASDSDNDDDNDVEKRKPGYRKPWRESTVSAPGIDTDVKIGEI